MGEACDKANQGIQSLMEAKEIIDSGADKSLKGVVTHLVGTTKVFFSIFIIQLPLLL